MLARNPEVPITTASFGCELEFRVVEVDPDTGEIEGDEDGFEENYPVEQLDLNTADYMAKVRGGGGGGRGGGGGGGRGGGGGQGR